MKIIAAMTKDRVIGKNNDLPWYIPEDLKNFKKFTTGNVIVMGRKTYESIGKPLPNRENIVVTRTVSEIPGCHVCNSFESAIEKAKSFGKEVFVIGGSRIFAAALEHADTLYISWVKKDYEGDVYFPEFENGWQEINRTPFEAFDLVEYKRKESPLGDN